MKIKSNVRAGAGGATGVGKNQTSKTVDVYTPPVAPVYVPAPTVNRCTGI